MSLLPAFFNALATVVLAADNAVGGRGENPDTGSGILIIFATFAAVVVAIGLVWWIAARRGSRTPKDHPHDSDQVGV